MNTTYVSSDTIFMYYYDLNVQTCAYIKRCKLVAKILPLHPEILLLHPEILLLHPEISHSKLYLIIAPEIVGSNPTRGMEVCLL